ncbi:hypothetical protein GCM10027598_13810 [Amycolatopsis oliviviridis]|uniref:Serine/threonine protein kinase n=1 Tax=Amycolatopsis oliviviridis TaxID=1471590 RepID=A0ABQ3LWF7_9PSEU|nr:hypothetical protein [Amycolatopsis oliviviridis]GHH25908.1 hypothetical protein GCM10017790_52330 [Amycolatopsis oliviviridis]
MGMKGIVAGAGLLAMTAGVFLAPQASATAPPPKLWVSPAKVAPGQALEFTASCYGTRTAVTSAGLTGPVTLEGRPGSGNQAPYLGHGKAAGKIGKYKASFHCDGGPNLPAASGTATVEFEIACLPPTTPPSSTPPSSSKPPSSSEPPSSSSKPPSSQSKPPGSGAPSSSAGDVVPAALTKPCGTPSPGKTPQVKVTPKGAPQTGGGAFG